MMGQQLVSTILGPSPYSFVLVVSGVESRSEFAIVFSLLRLSSR
jgi:hypothetical protein